MSNEDLLALGRNLDLRAPDNYQMTVLVSPPDYAEFEFTYNTPAVVVSIIGQAPVPPTDGPETIETAELYASDGETYDLIQFIEL